MIDVARVVDRILELSKADECIAIGWRSSTANVRWANNTTTTNGTGEALGLLIASVRDGAVGIVRRDAFTEEALPDLVRASEAACDGKPSAADRMPLLEADGVPADWDAEGERTEVGALAPVVPQLADLFARAGADDVLTYGYAEHGTTNVWLGTSSGRRRRDSRAQGKIEFTAKADGGARSTWAGRVLTSFDQVDVETMWERARTRLGWQAKRTELPAGRYEVVLEPSCVADMLLYMSSASGRRDADEGRTVFSKPDGNRIGEVMFPGWISLYSDPHEPELGATPFVVAGGSSGNASLFDNGLDLGPTHWIRDGALENLVTPRYWAERSGARATPMIGNLMFVGGDGATLEEMIAGTERGLIVTCLWYLRAVDPQTLLLTGLTRDGVFLVEGGEVVAAVNNFRFNVSPVKMLANAIEAGGPEPTLPREFEFGLTKMPPLRVADWHMSSVSAAT